MQLTPDQETHIRMLSDREIYQAAMTFANEQQDVIAYSQFNSQINGLLQFSRSWSELIGFVNHQKSRNWQGVRQSYGEFYTALNQQLNDLRRKVKDEFVPDDLTKRESNELTDYFAGLLAHEFIQHLAAEMMWKKEVKK
ncbi:MAG: hypothetical protein ACP5J4_18875 [Anaerolineae bacterium]